MNVESVLVLRKGRVLVRTMNTSVGPGSIVVDGREEYLVRD